MSRVTIDVGQMKHICWVGNSGAGVQAQDPPRHCEGRESQLAFPFAKRRGNPERHKLGTNWIASSQGLLAMTGEAVKNEREMAIAC
ncbi:MAG: hypothetical protein ABWY82_15490 [Tardiphaga sp.]